MEDQKTIAERILGSEGKMISFSKSGYMKKNPENLVLFNSNVCIGSGKIWYGDLDVTLSFDSLSELAKELDETVYVLTERDGRFEYEETPQIDNAVVRFLPDGGHQLDQSLSYYRNFNLKPIK
jgi:hypothetical protein